MTRFDYQGRDKESYVERLFALAASRYDLLNSVMSLGLHKAWRRFAVRQLGLHPGSRALDVAAGTADFTLELLRAVGPEGSVVGVDLCLPMLRLGADKLTRAGFASAPLAVANAEELPFADGFFDCATIGFALRNVASVEATIAEMARVVRPGGRVLSLEIVGPESRILKPFWRLYFHGLMPIATRLLGGSKEAYRYLPESVERFRTRQELKEVMVDCGLTDVEVRNMALGGGLPARWDKEMIKASAKLSKDEPLPWNQYVREEIQAVEQRLTEAIFSNVPAVFRVSEHLLSAGGKRLRPALVALSARLTAKPYDSERVVSVGAAVELIHMATLVHDDVIDQTGVRRGRATANSSWGNKVSVLSGDHMLSKAFWILSQDPHPGILQALASMTVAMSESEVLQATCEGDLPGWKRHYFDIIRGKTAGFFAACCKAGAIIGGADSDAQEALYSYGLQLGIAFQITDDVLDIAGSPVATGKPLGSDLREGKFTLPVLLTLDNTSGEETDTLLERLGRSTLTEEDIALVCNVAQQRGSVRMARDTAGSYADKAVESLESFPAGATKDSMSSLAGAVVGRRS